MFVDTYIFVRHFAQDVPDQSQQATAFLKRTEAGVVEVTVTETVLLELEHVLTSRSLPYQLDRARMVKALTAVLEMRGLRLPADDRLAYETAVDLYEHYPVDFGDALLAARMRQAGADEVATFDQRHFDRLPKLTRVDMTQYGP
ncbi:MAG: PIN domain-containing protein [Chloroflexi bacterium]|nr:PIN domain-containing protein [Chloroflexota bacterium]